MAEHFDALIVGRSLSALFCAALLAKRKVRVRLIAPDGAVPEPWPSPIVGLKASPIVRRLLDELGLVHAIRTRVEGEPGGVTVALPDRRFTLEPELAARGVELGRAFPEARADLLALFDRIAGYGACLDPVLSGDVPLPARGFNERRQLRKVISDLPASQLAHAAAPVPAALQPLLAALWGLMGLADDPVKGLTAAGARSVWLLCHGVAPIRGGAEALRSIVEAKLVTYGGQVETRRKAARLEGSKRRLRAMVTGDGHRVTADAFIFADDDLTLAHLAGGAFPVATAAPPGHLLRWHAPAATLPVDLRDPLAFCPTAGAPPCLVRREGDRVEIAWSGPERPPIETLLASALPGDVPAALQVAAPLPIEGEPFDLWRATPPHTPANLVRIGPSVLPGLGLEGEALSAWHAARHLAQALGPGLPWPFRRGLG